LSIKLHLEHARYGVIVNLPRRWISKEELDDLNSQLTSRNNSNLAKISVLDEQIDRLESKLKELNSKKAELEKERACWQINGTDDLQKYHFKALGHFGEYLEYLVDDNHVVIGWNEDGSPKEIVEVDPKKSYLCHECRKGFSSAEKLRQHKFHARVGLKGEKCIPYVSEPTQKVNA
jgi:hypothetical protein